MKTKLSILVMALAAVLCLASCEKEPRMTISIEASPTQWDAVFKQNGIAPPSAPK